MYSINIFIWSLACKCNTNGTVGGLNNCDKKTGACDTNPGCQKQYAGRLCNECEVGYFGYPDCKGM